MPIHLYATFPVTARRVRFGAALAMAAAVSACSTVAEKSNMLSDDRVVTESAATLGLAPADLKLVSRQTSGTNTFAVLRARDGKEFSCTINGGNLLSFGMTNPPVCQRR